MIFRDLTEVPIVLNLDVCRDLIEGIITGESVNLLPIGLRVPLDGSDAKLERPLYSRFLLHAVCVGAVIDLHYLNMQALVMGFDKARADLFLKVHEELDMGCPCLWASF